MERPASPGRAGIDPGNAACLAPPFNFPVGYVGGCGGAPFDTKDDGNRNLYNDVFAEYITGGDSLLQNACSGNNGWQQANCFETNVDIDPGSTVTITSVVTGKQPAPPRRRGAAPLRPSQRASASPSWPR